MVLSNMYVIGKDTATDKVRRKIEDMSVREQAKYFLETKSYIAYYAACWKMGLLTNEECSRLKTQVMKGLIK